MPCTLHTLATFGLFLLLLSMWATNPGYHPTPAMIATAVLLTICGLVLVARLNREGMK